ncbi:MAG: GNAT family N-acetyltransferase [Bacteriovoracia bacterium]
MIKFHRLKGEEARPYVNDMASLRLKVFRSFPYLYEGTLEYEKNYLATYFKARNSFIFLIEDRGEIVGATTSILASEEEVNFRKPFEDHGFDSNRVFYFGESVLLSEYRGQGFGKIFFQEREAFARTIPLVDTLSFCAVERPSDHPLKPQDYKPLNSFWESMGFSKAEGLRTTYSWKDIDKINEDSKEMQFWIKKI